MKYGSLPSGLRYAVRRSHSSVAYCSISIKCGTRDEEGFHNGIAHFVEHTLFKGTSRKSASVISSYLDRLGGELNAYTTKEEIVLHATVLKEDLPKAASLLFEIVTDATFPEKEIETEKGVVIDEINSYKDSPADDIYDRFEQMLFEDHPLSGLILGTASSVKRITHDELIRFVREKFVPSAMAFTVVADEDESRMERDVFRLVGRFFPDAVPSQKEEGNFLAPRPVHFDKTVNKRNHQVNCILGSYAPSLYCHDDRVAAVLLANILGGPASNSILNAVLREKNGLVYGVECSYTQYKDSGIMAISFGCDNENLEKCMKLINREIAALQEQPLSDRRLKAAKKQFLGQLAISGDNGETQCLSMGKSLLSYNRLSEDSENRSRIEAVTAQQIMETARSIFASDRLSRLVYL
ncbi:MAG: insulinase family protein [Bacteroidales bacterium]|nr:insulinase family protein [Bacteroidales bacterium]